MLVLQFGFDPEEPDQPHTTSANHVEQRGSSTPARTTHDTARGWYESLDARAARTLVDAELAAPRDLASAQPWWGLIRLALRLARARWR